MIGRTDGVDGVDATGRAIDARTVDAERVEVHDGIDWSELDRASSRRLDDTGIDPSDDRALDVPAIPQAVDRSRFLDRYESLDPSLEHVEPVDVHPDRFTPATDAQAARLDALFHESRDPEHWIEAVNPRAGAEAASATGRWENCCACARAFQDGLDGRPRVAATIDPRGLSLDGAPDGAGEDSAYTEQWAGRRFEASPYAEVGLQVERTGGSAIVHASSLDGPGHAFNVYWDNASGRVRWADAQRGVVGDWPPDELAAAFPCSSVMYFRGGTP
jgi:hypothetical protein